VNINVKVFIQRLQTFLFLSRFYVFNAFLNFNFNALHLYVSRCARCVVLRARRTGERLCSQFHSSSTHERHSSLLRLVRWFHSRPPAGKLHCLSLTFQIRRTLADSGQFWRSVI